MAENSEKKMDGLPIKSAPKAILKNVFKDINSIIVPGCPDKYEVPSVPIDMDKIPKSIYWKNLFNWTKAYNKPKTENPKPNPSIKMAVGSDLNQLVDVYFGRSKQFQYYANAHHGKVFIKEIIDKCTMRFTETVNYPLPPDYANVQINHGISTYGLFIIKVPMVETPGDLRELADPRMERKIRERDGVVIDTMSNHLYNDYLYVGRIKSTELSINMEKGKVVFMQLIDGEWKLLCVYELPQSWDTDRFTCEMNVFRDLVLYINKPMSKKRASFNDNTQGTANKNGGNPLSKVKKPFVIQHDARLFNDSYANPISNFLQGNCVMTFQILHTLVYPR